MAFIKERIKLKQKSFTDEGYIEVVPLEDVLRSFQEMERVYAPTIKMHKVGKEQLLWFLENSNFEKFLENVGETQKLYTELSIEDLMQAWLHPENIETVG